jgi:hypothetical protein
MSDLSVSSSASSLQQVNQSQWAQVKNDWQQLGQALQSGDLAGARKAFAALQKDAPPPPQGAASPAGLGSSTQDPFAALAKALQSGDLAGAQQAFSQLQQARGHHHHHHGAQSAASTSTAPSPVTPPAPASAGASGTQVNLTA